MVRTIRVVIELAEGGPTARVVVAVVVFVLHPTPEPVSQQVMGPVRFPLRRGAMTKRR